MKNQVAKYLKISCLVYGVSCYFSCSGNKSRTASDSTFIDSTITVKADTSTKIGLDTIHICTEMLPPSRRGSDFVTVSDTSIYFRDKQINDTIITNKIKLYKNKLQQAPMKAATWEPFIWDHTTLTVMFLDGDTAVQNKVITTAKEWEKYCGIRFKFGKYSTADITISFKYKGSWSYIGSFSSSNSPSMNLGWLTVNTDQTEYNRVVLHEFGHAIGFIHEHQNLNGNPIQWNKPLVYAYYNAPPNNWDKNDVDNNIFKKYSIEELNSTVFDPNSIMLYAFPASLTINGVSTHSNSKLSDLDKKVAAQRYPIGL